MNVINQKNRLYSCDEVDNSHKGRLNLLELFELFNKQASSIVVCFKRPSTNVSAKIFMDMYPQYFKDFKNVYVSDFEIRFVYVCQDNINDILSLLINSFYFFDQPSYIFLNNINDIKAAEKFIEVRSDWMNLEVNIFGYFVFKSVEDDVIWFQDNNEKVTRKGTEDKKVLGQSKN